MQSATLRLYLVRHGVTPWNRAQRMQGHSDTPLDSEGREQARLIGARLTSVTPAPQAVWSSDLSRARDTAEAIAAPLGLTVQTTPLLRETMLGDWEGLTRAEIEARGDGERLERYLQDSLRHRPPNSETLEAVWERMLRVGAAIRQEHPSGAVVVVGHGGSLRALLCEAMNAPITSLRHLWLDNASLSVVEYVNDPCQPMHWVKLLNDTSHLRPAVATG